MPKKTPPPTETYADHASPPITATAATPHRKPRGTSKTQRATPREAEAAIDTSPQLERIERALRDAADAAFHLAHDKASSAPERESIRRVRRAFLAGTREVPEFEDLAITADALLRAFERQLGPIDPRVGTFLVHEIASSLRAPRAPRAVRVRRVAMPRRVPRRAPHPFFDGERFYGLA